MRIPLELRRMIAEHAVQSAIEYLKSSGRYDQRERMKNIAISLVCKDICRTIRPVLFQRLRLLSTRCPALKQKYF